MKNYLITLILLSIVLTTCSACSLLQDLENSLPTDPDAIPDNFCIFCNRDSEADPRKGTLTGEHINIEGNIQNEDTTKQKEDAL
jgi:hypothetical protein